MLAKLAQDLEYLDTAVGGVLGFIGIIFYICIIFFIIQNLDTAVGGVPSLIGVTFYISRKGGLEIFFNFFFASLVVYLQRLEIDFQIKKKIRKSEVLPLAIEQCLQFFFCSDAVFV